MGLSVANQEGNEDDDVLGKLHEENTVAWLGLRNKFAF